MLSKPKEIAFTKAIKALLLCCLIVAGLVTSSLGASATNLRNISVDCGTSELDGSIYLFPGDSISINATNCTDPSHRPQMYPDSSGDPVNYNTSPVEMSSSSGSYILNADGTYTTSGGIFTGQTSGRWLPNNKKFAYIFVGESYFEVKLATNDKTTIQGLSLLESPTITIPATVSPEQTATDFLTSQDAVLNTYTFTVYKAGEYFVREIRTHPDTFFTDDAARIGTWAQPINPIWQDVALYSTFDRSDTELNRISLADSGVYEGSFISDGTVFGEFSKSLSVNLEPGTYTLVMFVYFPIEMWNATDGSRIWGAATDQSADFEIWGPEGGLTNPITLATTGQGSPWPLVALGTLTLVTGMLSLLFLAIWRKKPYGVRVE